MNEGVLYGLAAVCSSLWSTQSKMDIEEVLVSYPTEVI
jgi:hypothetical protein